MGGEMILFVEDETQPAQGICGVCSKERDTEFSAPKTALRRWHYIGATSNEIDLLSWT